MVSFAKRQSLYLPIDEAGIFPGGNKRPVVQELKAFDAHFRQAMQSRVALLDQISYYLVKTKGKQLRPLMSLLSAKLFGEINQKHLPLQPWLNYSIRLPWCMMM